MMAKLGRIPIARVRHIREMQRIRSRSISAIAQEEANRHITPEPPVPCMGTRCYLWGMHGCVNKKMCNALF